MKGFEYAKENGLTNADVKKRFNLKSHLSVIPDAPVIETKSKQAPCDEVKDTPVIEIPSKQEPEVSMDTKIKSCRGLGTKSKYWSELNG
jgi:hypothetical protein